MHSNRARMNKTVEICLDFSLAQLTTNSSNKFAANLNMRII